MAVPWALNTSVWEKGKKYGQGKAMAMLWAFSVFCSTEYMNCYSLTLKGIGHLISQALFKFYQPYVRHS